MLLHQPAILVVLDGRKKKMASKADSFVGIHTDEPCVPDGDTGCLARRDLAWVVSLGFVLVGLTHSALGGCWLAVDCAGALVVVFFLVVFISLCLAVPDAAAALA